jgi:hypothetical protein
VAARPITVTQAIGLAAFVGVLGAVFGASAPWFQSALGSLWNGARSAVAFQPVQFSETVLSLVASHGVLIAGVALCLLLAPIAVYLTVRED